MEGQADALEKMLYSDSQTFSNDAAPFYEMPKVNEAINVGLDTNHLTQIIGLGIQDKRLKGILRGKWERLWIEFESSHPGFFKSFYSRISQEIKRGRAGFKKDELIAIATAVEPAFLDWYRSQPALHSVNEHESKQMLHAIVDTKRNRILIINFITSPALPKKPEKVDLLENGYYDIKIDGGSYRLPTIELMLLDTESIIKTARNIEISINGVKVPITRY